MRAHGIVPESRTAPENGKRRPRPRDEGKHAKDGAGAPKNFDKAGVELEQGNLPAMRKVKVDPREMLRAILPLLKNVCEIPGLETHVLVRKEDYLKLGLASGYPNYPVLPGEEES